jgi:hypothetical protein
MPKEEIYKEITKNEMPPGLSEYEEINQRDFNKIKNLITNDDIAVTFGKGNLTLYFTIHNKIFMQLAKQSDDYFYLQVIDRLEKKYFKCDFWDGLGQCLKLIQSQYIS